MYAQQCLRHSACGRPCIGCLPHTSLHPTLARKIRLIMTYPPMLRALLPARLFRSPPHSHPIHPSPVLSSPSMLLTCLSPHPALVLPPRLLQRYQNVKSELEAQQNLERIRAEKMAQAGLLATASPAMLAGASGIAATGGKQVRRSRGWDRRARSGM